MPKHAKKEEMPTEEMPKEEKPKAKAGAMRKLSEKEKKLLKEHFEKHEPEADRSRKAKVRMALMRSKEVKSMKGLHKVAGM